MVKSLVEIITTEQDPELHKSMEEFVARTLDEFKEVLAQHEGEAIGGVSVCEAFWLYCLIKSIRPTQIIESGTFYGYSLYFIRSAAPPSCRVISFDPNMYHAPWREDVEYYEMDWLEKEGIDLAQGVGTLIFFDDHIDQGRRLNEAVSMDQEHIIFHDNYLSDQHSHRSIRFCDLSKAWFCYTLPALYSDPIFTDTTKNAQTYRWLTYVQRRVR